MRAVQTNSLLLLLFVAAGCSEAAKDSKAAPADESPKEKFTLDLHPRETPGSRAQWDIQTKVEILYSVEVNGAPDPNQDESATASLDVKTDVQIVTVDSKGTPTGLRGIVRSSQARIDGKTVPALPAGTQAESRTTGNEMTVTGLPFVLEPEITALAEGIFRGAEAEGPTDGDIFGTTEPRAIGEKWDVNVEQLKRLISTPEFSARDVSVTGSATLMGVVNVDGTECLHVRANSRIKDVKVDLPEGLTLSSATGTIRGNIYLDRATGMRRKDDGEVEFKLSAFAQPNVKINVTIKQSIARTITR